MLSAGFGVLSEFIAEHSASLLYATVGAIVKTIIGGNANV